DAFARRQAFHGHSQPRLNFFSDQMALGIQSRTIFPLAFEEVRSPILILGRMQFRSLILGTSLAASQVVQADVGDDAVEPGVKTALKAEAMKVAVNLQKGFLIDVARIFSALH